MKDVYAFALFRVEVCASFVFLVVLYIFVRRILIFEHQEFQKIRRNKNAKIYYYHYNGKRRTKKYPCGLMTKPHEQ